jgi:glycosyltransferase involved in cell wall biosynthesis
MRILLASDHYPPFVGGAQRQTKVLASELRARGHEVAVATVRQDGLLARSTEEGVAVHRLGQLRTLPLVRGKPRRRHQPPFADPVTVIELRRLLRELRPDIVHAAGWFAYSCAEALRDSDTPLLVSARDYGFSCATATLVHDGAPCSGPGLAKCLACAGSYYGRPRGWLAALGVLGSRGRLRERIDGLHSISGYVSTISARDFLADRGASPAGAAPITEIIPSFRVEDEPAEDRAPLQALPAEQFILFVGALRKVKGIAVLLDAYAQLADPPPLVLLGTRERDTPAALPPGARRIDPLPHWAVLEAWSRSMFGVAPSLWPEPFGSVVHEGMSRGRAVIGTTPGGHADMIEHGVNGLLVPAGDSDALREAMRSLIADAALRERLGRAAGERARTFAAATVVPRFEALYERLLASRQLRRPRSGSRSQTSANVHRTSALATIDTASPKR